jgi:uncharacterized protein YehS (DUF1456 family)
MSEKIKEIIEEAKKKLKEVFGNEDIDISEEKVLKYLKKVKEKEEKECELCIDSNA